MYRISCSRESKVKGTIRFEKEPWSLGYHTDVDGVTWDVAGYVGIGPNRAYVQACRVEELDPGLYDTSGASMGYHQVWEPYWVEVVKRG